MKTRSIIFAPFIFLFNVIILLTKVVFFLLVGVVIWLILQTTGITPIKVPVSGASMLPTLPESGLVAFRRYIPVDLLKPQLKHGDVVVFENAKTAQELAKQNKQGSGFVKRIIGLPGDRVVIRDGFVYLNDKFLAEPYTLKAHSTFGGTEIMDCQEITVPPNQLFVLGDNRKVSMDSRHMGLITYDDIDFYIPFEDQEKQYATKWRNTIGDEQNAEHSNFQINEYVHLLNQERAKSGVKQLTLEPKLNESARKRAEVMLTYDDLSFEATKSGYTMREALSDVNYYNIIYGEFPIIGYYDAQELFDSFMEQPTARNFLLNAEYEEIGISTFVGKLNGCPVQIMVQHVAGYKPPDYRSSDIQVWKNSLNRLREVQPSWQRLKDNEEQYIKNKTQIDRINEIIQLRITRMEAIVKRMDANEWLSEEEKQFMREDDSLYEEQNRLARQLNGS